MRDGGDNGCDCGFSFSSTARANVDSGCIVLPELEDCFETESDLSRENLDVAVWLERGFREGEDRDKVMGI